MCKVTKVYPVAVTKAMKTGVKSTYILPTAVDGTGIVAQLNFKMDSEKAPR